MSLNWQSNDTKLSTTTNCSLRCLNPHTAQRVFMFSCFQRINFCSYIVAFSHSEPHGVAPVSSVAWRQEGRGVKSQAVLCAVGTFSLCLCGFSAGCLANWQSKIVRRCECVVWMVGCLCEPLSRNWWLVEISSRPETTGRNFLRTQSAGLEALEVGWIVFIYTPLCLGCASTTHSHH